MYFKNCIMESSTSKRVNDEEVKSTSEVKEKTLFPGLFLTSLNSARACGSSWKTSYWSFVASLSFLCTGLLRAYTSPALLSIQNEQEESILVGSSTFSMTRKELISWIASTPPLASFLGTILSGPCLDQLGRQKTLFILTLPATVGWLLVANAWSVPALLFGRALTGLASGLATATAPLYISEMCTSTVGNTRKKWLGLLPGLMLSAGILLGFILAHLFQNNATSFYPTSPSWRRLANVISLFPVILSALCWTIPESPLWLQEKMRQAKMKEDAHSEKESKFDLEMEEVVPPRQRNNPKPTIKLSENTELIPRPTSTKMFSHHLILVSVLMILQQFSGGNVLIYYLSEIFTKTGNPSSKTKTPNDEMVHQASLIVGLVQFLGFFLAIPLIDHRKVGRKPLLIISALLMSLSHLLLGLHFHHPSNIEVGGNNSNFEGNFSIRVVLLCALYASYSIGLGPIPFQFIELFPSSSSTHITGMKRATSYISSIASLVNHLALFGVVKCFPYMFHMDQEDNGKGRNGDEYDVPLEHYHGPDVTFWIFSAICFSTSLFALFFVRGEEESQQQYEKMCDKSDNQ